MLKPDFSYLLSLIFPPLQTREADCTTHQDGCFSTSSSLSRVGPNILSFLTCFLSALLRISLAQLTDMGVGVGVNSDTNQGATKPGKEAVALQWDRAKLTHKEAETRQTACSPTVFQSRVLAFPMAPLCSTLCVYVSHPWILQ